jgi:hypothetical protein
MVALLAAALGVCAVAAIVYGHSSARSELLAIRMPNGAVVKVVPLRSLFGPGDLPIPIEDDGAPAGDQVTVAGSNVHLFEHFAPPQPYGMDNRRDPPYDTSFQGQGFGSDGR